MNRLVRELFKAHYGQKVWVDERTSAVESNQIRLSQVYDIFEDMHLLIRTFECADHISATDQRERYEDQRRICDRHVVEACAAAFFFLLLAHISCEIPRSGRFREGRKAHHLAHHASNTVPVLPPSLASLRAFASVICCC